MRSLAVLAAVPLLALGAVGPGPQSADASRPALASGACVCFSAVPRAQDARVAAAILDKARLLGSDHRTEILTALASNPTITPENELRLIEESQLLGSDRQAAVLVALARAVRSETP